MTVLSFAFDGIFAQVGSRPWGYNPGGPVAFIPRIEFAGIVSASNNMLAFTMDRCDPSYNIDVPTVAYTSTANGLLIFQEYGSGGNVSTTVTSYVRQ